MPKYPGSTISKSWGGLTEIKPIEDILIYSVFYDKISKSRLLSYVHQLMNKKKINYDNIHKMEYYPAMKRIKYWYMLEHDRTLKTLL